MARRSQFFQQIKMLMVEIKRNGKERLNSEVLVQLCHGSKPNFLGYTHTQIRANTHTQLIHLHLGPIQSIYYL